MPPPDHHDDALTGVACPDLVGKALHASRTGATVLHRLCRHKPQMVGLLVHLRKQCNALRQEVTQSTTTTALIC
jgi:hypothetical protein